MLIILPSPQTFLMKKFLLISNIILLLAVAFLYYEHYTYTNTDEHHIKDANVAASNTLKVAYFDLDTLQNHYEYYKKVRDYLNGKDSENQAQLNRLRDAYVAKAKEYNERGPHLSQTEQSDYEQQLMKMKNDYDDQVQQRTQYMQVEYVQQMQQVKAKITEYLKTYCKSKGFAYVLAANDNDYFYYKDTIRNITAELTAKLNELYAAENKK